MSYLRGPGFRNHLISVLILSLLVTACGEEPALGGTLIESDVERAAPAASEQMLKDYAFAQGNFAIRFMKSGFEDDENAVFSSYSLAEAMAMASTFGNFTDEEVEAIRSAVGIEDFQAYLESTNTLRHHLDERIGDADPDKVGYANLNDLWVEEAGTAESFGLDDLKRYFGVGVRQTELGSDPVAGAETINKYIEYHTRGLIPELLDPSHLEDVFAVVTAALYLKASWTGSFSDTSDRDFFVDDDRVIQTAAMRGTSRAATNLDAMTGETPEDQPLVVSIPLRGGFVFDIIAPPVGELSQYRQDFDVEDYYALLDELSSLELQITMPVFEINSSPAVKALMLDEFDLPPSVFEPGKIGDIIHEAVIDVNETGIEAAAATAVTFFYNGDPGSELSVSVDRPFLYFLRDEDTRMIFFSGQFVGE